MDIYQNSREDCLLPRLMNRDGDLQRHRDESWVLVSAARVFGFSMHALENQAAASITKRLFHDPGRKEIMVLLKAKDWKTGT